MKNKEGASMANQTNKFKGVGTDDDRKAVVEFYRNHVYGAYVDNFLEWNSRNKIRIIELLKQEFQDYDVKKIESIMNDYYSDF